jgi:hypothetical protein
MHGESNLKTFRDGFRVLGTIFREARRHRTSYDGSRDAAPAAQIQEGSGAA